MTYKIQPTKNEGSIPFTRSTENQSLTNNRSKSVVNCSECGRPFVESRIPKSEVEATQFALAAGVPESFTHAIYYQLDAIGWKDAAGRDITNFVSYLKHRWVLERWDSKSNGRINQAMTSLKRGKEAIELESMLSTASKVNSLTCDLRKNLPAIKELSSEDTRYLFSLLTVDQKNELNSLLEAV